MRRSRDDSALQISNQHRCGDTFRDIYGLRFDQAPVPFSQPGIVTIPLGFVVLVLVSLVTQPRSSDPMTERKPETVGA